MTRRAWTLSLLAVVIALATLMTPPMVMMPFRAQGPTELAIALAVLRFAPLLLAVRAGAGGLGGGPRVAAGVAAAGGDGVRVAAGDRGDGAGADQHL